MTDGTTQDPVQRDALILRGIEGMRMSKERYLAAARRDVNVFATLFNDEDGRPIKQGAFHREMQAYFDGVQSGILQAWPGAGKSIQLIIRALFELGHNPLMRIGLVSSTSDLGKKLLAMMKNNMEHNEKMLRVFPHLAKANFELWDVERIQIKGYRGTKKDFTVEVVGVGKHIYGSRYDLAILDDVMDINNSSTSGLRQKIVDWHDTTLLSRLTRGDREWIIGTPWNKHDFYHTMEERGYPCRKYMVEDSPTHTGTGTFLWPEQWDMERLRERKRKMTAWRYYQQYYMMDATPDQSPFTNDALQRCYVPAASYRNIAAVPSGYQIAIGVDLAVSKRSDSDKTVFAVLATDGTVKIILDIRAGRWSLLEIKSVAEALHRTYGGVFIVENVAAQDYLAQLLKAQTRIPVLTSTTTRGTKISEEWGIPGMAIDIENGRWQIPALPTPPLEIQELMDEMIVYNPQAHTGDLLMACYLAYSGVERIFRRGITVRVGSVKEAEKEF